MRNEISQFFDSHIVTLSFAQPDFPCLISRVLAQMSAVAIVASLFETMRRENHHLLARGAWRSPAKKSAARIRLPILPSRLTPAREPQA
jgi:hypothetical protein